MLGLLLSLALLAQPAERVADIQIQGNTLTPDARVIELAGIAVGAPFTDTTVADVQNRLKATHQFEQVEVLKRYASIADPSQVALIIVVDEGRVEVLDESSEIPGAVRKRRGPNLMFMPLLSGEDGYGITYGVQLALPEPLGKGSRISFPLTWGGEKRAAVETEVPLPGGPFTRLQAGTALSRRKHPFLDHNDDRRSVWIRGEKDLARPLRAAVFTRFEQLTSIERDRYAEVGVDATVDTRVDPFLPGNAVYGKAVWSRLQFDRSLDAGRSEFEARGYLRAPHASVIVVRALRQSSSQTLPAVMKPILGGPENLRGFRTGTSIGDRLVSGSVEWRVPLTSTLSRGKLGASVFVDTATAYGIGERLRDQDPERGVGAGLWIVAVVCRANFYVAHGVGGDTRAHFTLSTSF